MPQLSEQPAQPSNSERRQKAPLSVRFEQFKQEFQGKKDKLVNHIQGIIRQNTTLNWKQQEKTLSKTLEEIQETTEKANIAITDKRPNPGTDVQP